MAEQGFRAVSGQEYMAAARQVLYEAIIITLSPNAARHYRD